MGYGRCVGRVGALAVAMRMAVSIGVAVLVVAATTRRATAVKLSASSPPCTDTDVTCALVLGGTTVPTPDQAYLDAVRDHHVGPTHPDETIEYVAVTAPMTTWPVTGIGRIIWLVTGPQSIWVLVARRGRMSRCGSSRGSSIPPGISRCGAGSPTWSRRWPRTPTRLW